MSNYQSKISQKATYLRVYEGGRMLYGEEVTKVIHNLEKRIVELETYLKKVQADRINDISIERKRWAKVDLVALEILRLEQQIKGAERVYEEMEIYSSATDMRGAAQRVTSLLRNKLIALQEPKL
jgi:hypothetical protein